MPELIVLTLDVDYADEFDIFSAKVVTEDYWKEIQRKASELPKKEVEIYFGTNEFVEFVSYQDAIDNVKIADLEITDSFVYICGKLKPDIIGKLTSDIEEAYNEIEDKKLADAAREVYEDHPEMKLARISLYQEYRQNLTETSKHEADRTHHKNGWYTLYEEKPRCEICKELLRQREYIVDAIHYLDSTVGVAKGSLPLNGLE